MALTRDIFKIKEKEISDKYYKKHEELLEKVKNTLEYQRLEKKIEKVEKEESKLRKEQDKFTEHLGESWQFHERALESLKKEFIEVRIAVIGKEAEEVKSIITEFAKREFWEA
jgi:predicted GTPase